MSERTPRKPIEVFPSPLLIGSARHHNWTRSIQKVQSAGGKLEGLYILIGDRIYSIVKSEVPPI